MLFDVVPKKERGEEWGYLNVFSATAQRGGKMTKSAAATPGSVVGAVSTVKIDGSCLCINYLEEYYT